MKKSEAQRFFISQANIARKEHHNTIRQLQGRVWREDGPQKSRENLEITARGQLRYIEECYKIIDFLGKSNGECQNGENPENGGETINIEHVWIVRFPWEVPDDAIEVIVTGVHMMKVFIKGEHCQILKTFSSVENL